MAYTSIKENETTIIASHVTELKDNLNQIAKDKKVTVDISLDTTRPTAANITNLQLAINTLEGAFSNNCCQANCCQTCQNTGCQSSSCQRCQSCQTCQSIKCQSCQRECNCNCYDCE